MSIVHQARLAEIRRWMRIKNNRMPPNLTMDYIFHIFSNLDWESEVVQVHSRMHPITKVMLFVDVQLNGTPFRDLEDDYDMKKSSLCRIFHETSRLFRARFPRRYRASRTS